MRQTHSDTRYDPVWRTADPHHLNNRVVRRAEKLWRFDVTGIAVACERHGLIPRACADRLKGQVGVLETETGRQWARETLDATRHNLKLNVI